MGVLLLLLWKGTIGHVCDANTALSSGLDDISTCRPMMTPRTVVTEDHPWFRKVIPSRLGDHFRFSISSFTSLLDKRASMYPLSLSVPSAAVS